MKLTAENKVWKISPLVWENAKENDMSTRLYNVLLKWIPFANNEFQDWDHRPNAGYFFGGDFWYSSECSSTALVFATVAKLGRYDQKVTGISRNEIMEKAIKAIRYMGFTHDTGPKDCVRVRGRNKYTSGKKWGGEKDNFFMASQNGRSISSFATAAWLLWKELDDETKILVQNVVSNYADRFCEEAPRSGSYYDTQCEENAWTAAGLATALALFKEHPNHDSWNKGFINWSINTITTYWDRITSRSGLIEKLDNDDIKTINFHPDYTTENHAFVHPSYLCAGINLRAVHVILASMAGEKIESSAIYNNEKLYEKTVKIWSQFDGLAVPIQGQDWWYNRQHERQLTHAVLNVVHKNRDAATLEQQCLGIIEKIQASNKLGCLLEEDEHIFNKAHSQSSKDFEPGSALDLVNSYLLHAFSVSEAKPIPYDELTKRLTGVYKYPHGGTIINRTSDTFTSFSWRNNVTLLTLPKQGTWNITPLFNSYTGVFKFKKTKAKEWASNENAISGLEEYEINQYKNGFGAIGIAIRGDNEIAQYIAVVSLPNGYSLYNDKIEVLKDCDLKEAYTGIIGVRNENYKELFDIASGKRTLYLPGKEETFNGFLGPVPNIEKSWKTPEYLNLDSKLGYIIKGSNRIRYINRHQFDRWKGIEDLLILNDIDVDKLSPYSTRQPFLVLTMPNQTFEETKEVYKKTTFLNCDIDNIQLLITENYLIYINFNKEEQWVSGNSPIIDKKIYIFDGWNKLIRGRYCWESSLKGFQSGFCESEWLVTSNEIELLHVDIHVQADKVVLLNRSEELIKIRLINEKMNKEFTISLGGLSFKSVT